MVSEEDVEHMVRQVTRFGTPEATSCISTVVANIGEAGWRDVPLRIISILDKKGDLAALRKVAQQFLDEERVREIHLVALCWNLGIAGDPEAAVAPLEEACSRGRLDGNWMLFLAHQHARLGNEARALRLAAEAARSHPNLREEARIERQFFRFVTKFDQRAAQAMLNTIMETFRRASIAEVEADILRALELGHPYLLLRLGDGEGSVTRVDHSDTLDNEAYYRANQKEFLRIWFDDETIISDYEFDKVIDRFNAVVGQADCLGGIYQGAIDHEYRIGSRRGIAWVVNTMRKALALAQAHPEWAARTSIHHLGLHYDLLLSGALARILQGRDTVGLISCQPDLAEGLKRTYGIREVEFFKVPGEQIHRASLGTTAVEGKHWPDRFRELCDVLDRPADRRGRLFLVAAGMLGKIYAGKLKESGAVVLDIGAVADLWMGKVTRQFPKLPSDVSLNLDGMTFVLVAAGNWAATGTQWLAHLGEVRTVVFEPLPHMAQNICTQLVQIRSDTVVFEGMLSGKAGAGVLHVTRSQGCSSLARPASILAERYSVSPAFEVVRTEEVTCLRYEDLAAKGVLPQPDVIEIGLQGTEHEVLDSFGDMLTSCLGIRMKVYFGPVYDGQEAADGVCRRLSSLGLTLRKLTPVPNFDGDIVEAEACFTIASARVPELSRRQTEKLLLLERVWDLPSRREMFEAEKF